MRKLITPFLFVLFLSSCGYRLVGTAPEGKRLHIAGSKVYVAPFKNRTSEPNVEYYITNNLIFSLQRTAKITVVSKDQADYTIEGEVLGYSKRAVALDSSGDVSVYRLTVVVRVRVYDTNGKLVAEYPSVSEYEDYNVYDEIERTKAEERRAVRRVSEGIAQQIASLLL